MHHFVSWIWPIFSTPAKLLFFWNTVAVFIAAAIWNPSPAKADVYAYMDAEGVAHYTNVQRRIDQRYSRVLRTPEAVMQPGARSVENAPHAYDDEIFRVSRDHEIDPNLLRAVIAVESGFNPGVVSRKGAIGLMQLMPATAERFGVTNPYDPLQNLQGGAKYLKYLLSMFSQNTELALAAYNAGEQAVIRNGHRIPPYAETLAYVPKVLQHYNKFKRRIES